jgi:hypothetical protein
LAREGKTVKKSELLGTAKAADKFSPSAFTVKFSLKPVIAKISSVGRLSKNAQSLVIVGTAWEAKGRASTKRVTMVSPIVTGITGSSEIGTLLPAPLLRKHPLRS